MNRTVVRAALLWAIPLASLACNGTGPEDSSPRADLPRDGTGRPQISAGGPAAPAAVDGLELSPPELTVTGGTPGAGDPTIELRLHNSTGGPVTLIEAGSTCACTMVELPAQRAIEPGGQAALAVKVQLPRYGTTRARVDVKARAGAKTVTLSSMLTLEGDREAMPRIVKQPQIVEIAYRPAETAARAEFLIYTYEPPGSDAWLAADQFDSEVIAVRAQLASERILFGAVAERCYQCAATLQGPQRADFDQRFTPIAVRPPAQPIEAILLRARKRMLVSCVPEELFIRASSSENRPLVQDLFVFRATGEAVAKEAIRLESDADWITIEATEPPAERAASDLVAHFRVMVRDAPPVGAESESVTAKLVLRIEGRPQEAIEIPVTFARR